MTDQDRLVVQTVEQYFEIGDVIEHAGLAERRRRLTLAVMKAKIGRICVVAFGGERCAPFVEGPAAAKGAVNHHDRRTQRGHLFSKTLHPGEKARSRNSAMTLA